MAWFWRLWGVLLLLWSAWGQAAIEVGAGTVARDVAAEIAYLRDDSGRWPLADVLAKPLLSWQQNGDEVFNQGYNSATWWLRFAVRNGSEQATRQLLEIAYPVLDDVEVWVLVAGQVQAHYRLGDKRAFHERPIDHRHFLVPLQLPAGGEQTVLLRVRSTSSVQVPMTLWDERAYFDHDQTRLLGQGIYFGTMLVMVLYNLFVYLAIGERNYLYYVLYVLCMPLFLASLNGLAFQYLWPGATQWNDQAIIVSLAGVVLFGLLFTNRFLQLRQHLPIVAPALWAIAVAAAGIIAASFFVSYAIMIRVLIGVAVVACLGGLFVGCVRWLQGDVTARFYTIAWSSMLLGGIILALNKFHFLPQNVFTENATQIGSALEVILLSFALAERINQERRMRFEAQQEALSAERMVREAQAEALSAQRQANESLEQRVRERTEALEAANRKLEELSATDQLTGLKNRRHLDRTLREEFVRCFRYKHPIAVLLLDIDHFKQFNDTWGHLVGDDCLRSVAEALTAAVRWPSDRIARYGGEEFCVVMPETEAEGAHIVAERIRVAVEELQFEVNGRPVPVTVSIGVAAVVPTQADGGEQLVAAADKALYQAKAAGRNRVELAASG